MKTANSLQQSLDAYREGWATRVGDEISTRFANDINDLRNSGILERAATRGDQFPRATKLLDAHSKAFDIDDVLNRGPAIVTFYRGGWCPYCNLELRAYQSLLLEIQAAGASLIAISPELPDHSLTTAEKNDLAYPVLSDVNGELAAALGIRFELSDNVRPFYEKAGHNLPERNGSGTWALPIPATFVVAKGGEIIATFIDPDYRKRADPNVALDALRNELQTA
jgi:peroxiredoxin